MSKLTKRHFWEWFTRHNKEYLELNKKRRKEAIYWLNELNAHLRAYFKFLHFSIILNENGTAILTISVNGKSAHFKKAEAFVAQAPEIDCWKITALEDPMPIDHLIEDNNFDPRELFFSFASNEPDETDIILYHLLCTDENQHLISEVAHTAVYNLLGERSFGTDIGNLEVANFSSAGKRQVLPLKELPAFIGMRRSSMAVDSSGCLMYLPIPSF